MRESAMSDARESATQSIQAAPAAFLTRAVRRRGFAALAGLITACVVVTGCGSSAPASTTRSPAGGAQALAFSKCIRSHGVPSFPDPGANISGPYDSIGGVEIPQSIDVQSPAFQNAMTSCRGLLAAVFSSKNKPHITASLKASLVAHAQCMRTHGVPGYQDPTFPPNGGIAFTDAGTNPQSPAYRHAAVACGNR